jgi:hypothetical protein
MMYLLDRYGRLPIEVSSDLTRAVELAKKGGVLSVEDLERAANDVLQSKAVLNLLQSCHRFAFNARICLAFPSFGIPGERYS